MTMTGIGTGTGALAGAVAVPIVPGSVGLNACIITIDNKAAEGSPGIGLGL